jgi:hypothetical protein
MRAEVSRGKCLIVVNKRYFTPRTNEGKVHPLRLARRHEIHDECERTVPVDSYQGRDRRSIHGKAGSPETRCEYAMGKEPEALYAGKTLDKT